MISACVLVYAVVAYLGQSSGVPFNSGLVSQPSDVLVRGALIPSLVAEGQWWRLLTSIFLHSSFIHLASNMLALYFLGSLTEEGFGSWRFLALYVASGISGGLAYLYFGAFEQPAVGASGAIFGLMGSVLGYSLRRGTFSRRNPLITQLLFLLAINLYLGFAIPNVSNTAHIGGLAGGLLFGYLMAASPTSTKRLRAVTPVLLVFGSELGLFGLWLGLL
jgi:rhomboid protease GluP